MEPHSGILLDCEYFPCIAWYEKFVNTAGISIEIYEQFERASLRNRCYVAGPNGRLTLTVPLEGGRNNKVIMKDIRICYRENWPIQHWRTLQACYSRTPYFEFFGESVHDLLEKRFTYLIDLNLETLHLINRLLSFPGEHSLTSNYEPIPATSIADYRSVFNNKMMQAQRPVIYPQPFQNKQDFIPGLSMLDMLFCIGKQGLSLLRP